MDPHLSQCTNLQKLLYADSVVRMFFVTCSDRPCEEHNLLRYTTWLKAGAAPLWPSIPAQRHCMVEITDYSHLVRYWLGSVSMSESPLELRVSILGFLIQIQLLLCRGMSCPSSPCLGLPKAAVDPSSLGVCLKWLSTCHIRWGVICWLR